MKPSYGDDKKVVVYSPNGAACAELVKENDIAYIGCLLNAKAVGEQVTATAKEIRRNVSVIAAGEKRARELGGQLEYLEDEVDFKKVFAVEDYLGCGAIISYINLPRSPEAEVSELAFRASKNKLKKLLLESFSGRYLVQTERKEDVEHSSQLNLYNIVPVIRKGIIEKLS